MESYNLLLQEHNQAISKIEEQEKIISNLNNSIQEKINKLIILEIEKDNEKNQYENTISHLNNELNIYKNKNHINEIKNLNDELKKYYEKSILDNNISPIDIIQEYNSIIRKFHNNNNILKILNNNINYIKNICYPCNDEMKDEEH